ncbi:alpha-thujene synthase TPS3, chloroplastic-like [Nymphaea colorata]|nr:alpha-thujene synthase TPS3, chloroplastic-like [Nymphaea colorata]
MAAHLASFSTPFVTSPRLAPNTKAGFKPWSTTLVRCEPRTEGCGVAFHFEIVVRRSLDAICTSTRGFEDLYSSLLRFRILRQHGYYVSAECFSRFREQSGRFTENLCEDVRGLLRLYEASQLACEGETELEEATALSSEHLRARISHMEQRMSRQVQRALQVLLHRRVRRVEAREYIETFERTDSRSQVLHEFARPDFNMVQTIHQRELRELSGWWRDLGLDEHISFARDRLVESYFVAVGKMHGPQFSQYRMQLARVSYLMATIEDIFDEHQWDLQAAEQLPQSLRVFYVAVYNTTNQISYTVLRRHGRDITSNLRRVWVSVCRAYLVEARWHHAQQTPRLEEYLSNIWAAMTGPILLPAYFFLSQNIEEQAIQQLQSESDIINLSSMIVRLSADLQRSRVSLVYFLLVN